MLIDTHTHIADPEFDADREAVIERARAAGVRKMILIGTDLPSSRRAVSLAEQHPFLWAAVGLHPHEAKAMDETLSQALEELAGHPKVVGLGETGLDYHYNHSSPEDQRRAFIEQIRLAKRKRLPLVIHTREAWEETFRILEQEGGRSHAADVGAVFHCFTGDSAIAAQAVRFGCYLSFSGIMTFPKALALQQAAASVDLSRLLIETDAPYLAPQGYRGKRNEPAYVRVVAEKIAALRNCPLEKIAEVTSGNAERLFQLSPR
ncbi:MAG: TatD family deoxyribonuclease [Candidatus Manganitrophaceae bacterium]|nr:MAG: TatD family deoxyribonuclease [Candidatus Manganitrophaceae bacterium]